MLSRGSLFIPIVAGVLFLLPGCAPPAQVRPATHVAQSEGSVAIVDGEEIQLSRLQARARAHELLLCSHSYSELARFGLLWEALVPRYTDSRLDSVLDRMIDERLEAQVAPPDVEVWVSKMLETALGVAGSRVGQAEFRVTTQSKHVSEDVRAIVRGILREQALIERTVSPTEADVRETYERWRVEFPERRLGFRSLLVPLPPHVSPSEQTRVVDAVGAMVATLGPRDDLCEVASRNPLRQGQECRRVSSMRREDLSSAPGDGTPGATSPPIIVPGRALFEFPPPGELPDFVLVNQVTDPAPPPAFELVVDKMRGLARKQAAAAALDAWLAGLRARASIRRGRVAGGRLLQVSSLGSRKSPPS